LIEEEPMPLYEFICLDCGKEFETLVLKKSEAEKVKCPACSGKRLEEKFSSFASVSKSGASTFSGAANCAPSG
jgi:putative FmdB family regulatory protein